VVLVVVVVKSRDVNGDVVVGTGVLVAGNEVRMIEVGMEVTGMVSEGNVEVTGVETVGLVVVVGLAELVLVTGLVLV
jgi:hypothetical protein